MDRVSRERGPRDAPRGRSRFQSYRSRCCPIVWPSCVLIARMREVDEERRPHLGPIGGFEDKPDWPRWGRRSSSRPPSSWQSGRHDGPHDRTTPRAIWILKTRSTTQPSARRVLAKLVARNPSLFPQAKKAWYQPDGPGTSRGENGGGDGLIRHESLTCLAHCQRALHRTFRPSGPPPGDPAGHTISVPGSFHCLIQPILPRLNPLRIVLLDDRRAVS